MSLYKKTSFARLMSVTALCVGIFLWIYMFCINPAEGTYTPIPEDSLAQQELTSILGASYVPDEIIIKFKPSEVNLKTSLGQMEIKTLAVEENLEKADMITSKNLVLMKIEDDMSVEQKISELQANPDVEYAEPNYIRYALGSLTDYNDTYAHLMTGLLVTDWPDAMDILNLHSSLSDTLVAVIDVGVAYNHPDLVSNMRDGSNCKSYTGVSIAGGCIHGYDFYHNDNDPYPRRFSTHATHIAGTIAATINNATGIMGINPHATIMAIRVGDDDSLSSWSIVQGIMFATQNHAKVINASYGGAGYSSSEYDAINAFGAAGGLFIAAAGNGGQDGVGDNNDITHNYPSDYTLANIIAVAATTTNDGLASFSNYGSTSIDVGAPGTSIWSTTVSTQNIFADYFSSSFTGTRTVTGTNPYRGIVAGELYGDATHRSPYKANSDTTVALMSGIDLSTVSDATILWYTKCDTESTLPSANSDYMALELSADGSTFTELGKWNESTLRNIAGYNYVNYQHMLTGAHMTKTFSLRFRRHSDNDDNTYDGCLIDNVRIIYPSVTGQNSVAYEYKNGTSMATPHVVGLASMLRSINSGLTAAQVKTIIMSSGDSIPALNGKTVSGKRINMHSAVAALGIPTTPNRGDIYTSLNNLLSGQGINNNLNTITSGNVTHATGIYFAVRNNSGELGKITFTTGIDFSNSGTQSFISGTLASVLDIELGRIAFAPEAGFIEKPARITMYIPEVDSGLLSSLTQDFFVVTNLEGDSLDPKDIISSVTPGTCANGLCAVDLEVDHFTAFDIRPILSSVHIESDNEFSPFLAQDGNKITITFSALEPLAAEPTVIINEKVFSGSDLSGQVDRSASFIVGQDVSIEDGDISFIIEYADQNGNTGTIVNTSTDNSFVVVSNSPVSPSTPTITSSVSLTHNDSVEITGTTSAHALVTIFEHGERDSVVTQRFSDRNGLFSINVPLTEGIHEFQAYATNISQEHSNDSNSLTITRDTTPPALTGTTLAGTPVVSGAYYATGVSFDFSGTDISGATLNGNAYTSNTPITTEGAYTFTLQDIAGNTSSLSFTLDFTAPTFLGGEDGHLYNHSLLITGNDNFAFSGFELNGIFSLDMIMAITQDGTYTLTGYDRAGNADAISFSIDQIAPIITGTTLEGTPVVSGEYYATGISFSFSDPDIASATLNSDPYISDTLITTEGQYTFTLEDTAGNSSSLSFTLDFTAPTFLGGEDGHLYNHSLLITGNDNFAFSGFELNGIFSLDMIMAITQDGTYTLTGYDRANNTTTISFSIDQIAPIITGTTLEGTPIISGEYYATGVYFSFSETDISGATLNDVPYISDTPITTEGNYTFTLEDTAGNSSSLSFTLDFTAPLVTPLSPASGSQISDTNTVTFTWTGSDNQTISGYIFVLTGTDDTITYTTTGTTYTTTLTSGSYTRYITAVDRANNSTTSSGSSFTVNSTVATTITLLTGNLYHHTSRYTKDYAQVLITTTTPTTYAITGDFTTSPLTGSLTDRFTGSIILTAPDGAKSIFVQTTNEFFSTGKSFSLILDTTAPTLPLLTTITSGTILSGAFTLDRSDSIDSGAGVSGYQYIISTTSGTGTTGIVLSGFVSSSSTNITNGLLTNGLYYRYIKAFDMLGHVTTSEISSFEYSGSLDTVPDQFNFEDIDDADLDESYLSDPVTITGLSANTPVLASISKGVLYISGEMVGTTGYVQNGRNVQIELISRDKYDSAVNSTLTIGGISDTFTVTTKESDNTSDSLSKTQKLQVVAIFEVLQDLYEGSKAQEFFESLLLMIEDQMDDYDDDELEYITLSYLYDLVEDYYEDEFDSDDDEDDDTHEDTLDDVSWVVNGIYTAPNGKKYTITYDSKKKQFTSTNFLTPKYFPTLDVLKYTIDINNPAGSQYMNAKTIKARWGKIALDGTRQTSPYTAPNRKVFYFFKTMSGKYSSYTFSTEKYFDSLEEVKGHIYSTNHK